MRRFVLIVITIAVAAGAAAIWKYSHRTPEGEVSGIALTLAEDRAARVSDLRYDVTFTVPAKRDEPIAAHMRAQFLLKDTTKPLAFDFAQPVEKLISMHANRTIIPPLVDNQHIVIPASVLVEGENLVEFEFVAGDAPLNRSDEFVYALFVPARASQAMPVFDQPDLKAKWRLILNIPKDWTAVSNGKQAGHTDMPEHTGLVFDQTLPIPTYLFSFAAGKFSIDTDQRNGRTFRMFHRETDPGKLAKNRQAIYDLHAQALTFLESYTGIPYPFEKFDFVAIPSFQFGGMEHPGSVFYNASSLFLDESATQNQMLGRASLIAHETAHMWFGDLVTMKWFNDVWMKEVFANFMAAKIVNPSFPNVNHELRFLYQHYPAAYDVDRTEGANPIRQDLANLNEAGSLYGAIIYQKAPIVMRQLELLMGADKFRDGLREYLGVHKFANATWSDLIKVLDAKTDADLTAWSRAWVEDRGRPRITIAVDRMPDVTRISITQDDPLGRSLAWPERLSVAIANPGHVVDLRDVSLDRAAVINLPPSYKVAWVLPTAGGLGYGDFVLDSANLEAVATAMPTMANALMRGSALVTLWESMLEGRLTPDRMRAVLAAALPAESDELNISQMLEYSRGLYWRYTAADDRAEVAPALEALIKAGLDRAKTTSQKAAWFGTLRSVATTAETLGWLEKVWKRDVKIPGLPLSENDEAELALDLALRDVPAAATILDEQFARLTNSDRKARFAFVRPAVSSDPSVREGFFNSLKDVKNRRRESWVLDGARYLHHPLRSASSRRFVHDALVLVREIQQTGDIFFPKRWADATLSGYQSPPTAAEVRQFINGLPEDYPQRLKWVLLSSADPLFRAARILHQ